MTVAALGAFILLVERRGQTTKEREEQARRALHVDAARVSYLRFETTNLVVECAREGDDWMVVQPVRARAASAAIGRILAGLEDLPRGEVITDAERRARGLGMDDYGFDQPRARVTYGDSLQRRTVVVGRDAPLGGQLYVKADLQSDIIATSTNLLTLLPESVASLRDRSIFRMGPERVQRLEIGGAGGFLQVARQERGRWMIQQPVMTRAATPAMTALLDGLFQARVAEFVSDAGEDAVVYGFDDPTLSVTVGYVEKDGEDALVLGDALKTDPSLLYAKRKGEGSIYAVSTNVLTRLRTGLGDLRDRRLTTLSAQDVSWIEIRDSDRKLALQQQDGTWRVAEPRQWKADEDRVRELVSAWVAAPALAFVDGVGTNPAEHGFVPPEQELVLGRSRPGAAGARDVESVRIRVSRGSATATGVLVRIEGEDALREVDSAALDKLSVDPLFYRDREVLSVNRDDIVSVTVQDESRKQTIARDEAGAFRPVDQDQFVLNHDALVEILMVLGELRAVEFVADEPDDMAPFGLEEPAAVLTIGLRSEAGISRSVLFGSDAGESGVYAMIRGRDVVFVLEKAVRSALLANLYAVPPKTAEEPLEAITNQ